MKAGDVIAGRYRLEQLLGAGGMGCVWSAVHTVTEQRRALKFVNQTHEGDVRRALREARAASAIRHAHVVEVHDVLSAEDGSPVLVMDCLEGETLGARLRRERTLAPAEVVRIACGMLDGLAAAHALGVVHRDLKPENVFLARTENAPAQVRILDFGVAKLTADSGPARATHGLTGSGALMGTPCYMAPEQAFDGAADARTDLWAVGVILYEALAGVRPVDGASVGHVFKVLATDGITPLRERVPELPPQLSELVDRLLAHDPALRPASARAALDAMRAVDLSRPHSAQVAVSAALIPAAASRAKTYAAAGLALVALAAGAVVLEQNVSSQVRSVRVASLRAAREPVTRAGAAQHVAFDSESEPVQRPAPRTRLVSTRDAHGSPPQSVDRTQSPGGTDSKLLTDLPF